MSQAEGKLERRHSRPEPEIDVIGKEIPVRAAGKFFPGEARRNKRWMQQENSD